MSFKSVIDMDTQLPLCAAEAIDIKIAIVIPCFNRADVTLACVRRLNAGSVKAKIFVCDSGSTDGTPDILAREKNVNLLHVGVSSWWSAAVNKGVEKALASEADIILIINDDIVFDESLIPALIKAHLSYPKNIVCPIQSTDSGVFVGTIYQGIFRRVLHLSEIPQGGLVESSNGCCLLIPKEVFASVGRFDEKNCPHLYGDTEFQLRAHRAGFPTRVCPDARILQMAGTDYFSRLKLSSLFSFEGSPLHWCAYKAFGKALYGSSFKFGVLGLRFHLDFLKVLVKALKFLTKRKLNNGEK